MVRSGAWPFTVALAESLPALGSVSFSAVLVAVFVIDPVVVTVAVMVSVCEALVARPPMFQTPVPLLYVPALGVADTNVKPAGSWSVICTPVPFDGPALVTVIVKSTFEPTAALPLLAIFATAMSACEVTAVRSDEESFPVLTSPPPDTDAVFVSGFAAARPTATVMVIVG